MFVLGSASSERRQLARLLARQLKVSSHPFDERSVPERAAPRDYVLAVAVGKMEALLRHSSFDAADLVCTADTVVSFMGAIRHKPRDARQARDWVHEYCRSGGELRISTGHCLSCNGKQEAFCTEVVLPLRRTPAAEWCWDALLDKAGAFDVVVAQKHGLVGSDASFNADAVRGLDVEAIRRSALYRQYSSGDAG